MVSLKILYQNNKFIETVGRQKLVYLCPIKYFVFIDVNRTVDSEDKEVFLISSLILQMSGNLRSRSVILRCARAQLSSTRIQADLAFRQNER